MDRSKVYRWLVSIALPALLLCQRTPAVAAEITDVADAADTIHLGNYTRDDPFDLYIGPLFQYSWGNGKITREPIDRPGLVNSSCSELNTQNCLPVDELRYTQRQTRIDAHAEIGIYHDLSFVVDLPIILYRGLTFRYAKNVGPLNSTVDPANKSQQLFPADFHSEHKGLGNIAMGLRWGILNDERDDTKPAWVVFFTSSMPWTAKTYNPKVRASASNPGSVGDGVYRLTMGMALSKRLANFGMIGIDPNIGRRGYTAPYVEFSYTLPIPSDKALVAMRYANTVPDATGSKPNKFGNGPSQEANLDFGLEIIPYEDVPNSRKISIDLGMRNTFYSEGRNYSLLTDPLQELTFTQQYFSLAGLIGLYVQAAQYVRIKTSFSVGYITSHYLTYENVGIDVNGDGQVLPGNGSPDQLNPYFCGNSPTDLCSTKNLPSYDQVGFRFRDAEHIFFNFNAALLLTF